MFKNALVEGHPIGPIDISEPAPSISPSTPQDTPQAQTPQAEVPPEVVEACDNETKHVLDGGRKTSSGCDE